METKQLEEKAKEICTKNAINYNSFNLKGNDYELSNKYDCNQLFIAMLEFYQQMMKEQLPKILQRVANNATAGVYENDTDIWAKVDYNSILSQEQEILKELNMGANIEIKPCPGIEERTAIATAKAIKEHWPKDLPPPLVSSFSMESLVAVKKVYPNLIIGALFETLPNDWKQIILKVQAQTVHIDYEVVNEHMINEFKSKVGKPNDVVIGFGNAKINPSMKNYEPSLGKGLIKLFHKSGYKLVFVDEYRTSITCSCCESICSNT